MSDGRDTVVERHAIQFGEQQLTFDLTYSRRKRLKISVRPDQSVTVDAPEDRSFEDIIRKVRKRADWVVKQMDYFDRFQPLPTPRQYIGGETHIYLGRQYRLKLISDDNEQVKLIRGYLQVYTRDCQDANRVRGLLESWYREHAKAVMLNRFDHCYEAVERFGIPQPTSILFRRMDKRWGSCGNSGSIILNTELAKAPIHCIDYVITHELCHLKHRNHSKDFLSLLTICMPDWERRKERLERVVC